METERIAKFLARTGVGSRRECERFIEAGRVVVNGKKITSPALNVSVNDKIEFDGNMLAKPPLRMWMYHKPSGLVTTRSDEKGRETIYDKLPDALAKVNTVGRLDLNSEGLLLLTNDGELKRVLELPKTGWRRKYRVRAYGKSSQQAIDKLAKGVTVDGEKFRPMEIELDREQGDNGWYTVAIREGRNREIRRAFETVGLNVNRLIRTSYGPFQLGSMSRGEVTELRARALKTLLGGLLPAETALAEAPLDLNPPEEKPPAQKGRKSTPQRPSPRQVNRSRKR